MNFDTTMLIEAKRLGLAQGVPNSTVKIHRYNRYFRVKLLRRRGRLLIIPN
jgi:hypothetical protein